MFEIIDDEAIIDDNNVFFEMDSTIESDEQIISQMPDVSDQIASGNGTTSSSTSTGTFGNVNGGISTMSTFNDCWSANPFDSLVLLSSLATDVSQVEEV